MPASPPEFNRQPWPMKWIFLAIVTFLVPYTWITLAYRKPGHAYEPYQDAKERAQVIRLLDAGFQQVDLQLERLVEPGLPAPQTAATAPLAGGLPPVLRDVLIDQPALPSAFANVAAPATQLAGAPYEILITAEQPDHDERPAASSLYLHNREAVFIVGYDVLPGDLQARDLTARLRLVVPANTFTPGTYQATLIGARESRRWTFEVR